MLNRRTVSKNRIVKRVLLINPPSPRDQVLNKDNYFPLSLLSLATVLKNKGIDAKILDIDNHYYLKEFNENILRDYIENKLFDYIRNYSPDVIGIGCLFSGRFRNLKLIAGETKRKFPRIPIVIGGIHPTIFADDILRRYDFIDYIIIGEGEFSFLQLVGFLNHDGPSLEAIDGIAFRNKGDIRLNPKTKFIDVLDELPFADYEILNIKDYEMDTANWYSPKGIKVGQPFPIISSRSCPNRCNFCSMRLVHGPKLRYRSSNNVLDEMELLYNRYNVTYFRFIDDNLTFNKKRILEICQGIVKRNLNIQFDTPNGVAVNRLDAEIIDAMIDAGLVKISLAIESGDEFIRNKIMRKNLSTEKIFEIAESCLKYNHLFIVGYFIIGMPEETHETLTGTYEMIKRLPLDYFAVNFATPYPGTELFDLCIKSDLLFHKTEDYVDIDDLQYGSIRPHLKPFNLTIDDLLNFQIECRDLLEEKRAISDLPVNFPLRFKRG